MHLRQPAQERRQQSRAGGRDCPQPQFASDIQLVGRKPFKIGGSGHQCTQRRKQPGGRGRGGDPPSGSSNERRSQLRLHHLDPQCDGSRGQSQPAGSAGNRTFFDHSDHSSGKVRIQEQFS